MTHKASKEAMEKLHSKMADLLAEMLEGEQVLDEEGKVTYLKPSASIINVARQFLKDNAIEGVAVDESPLAKIRDTLPEFNDNNSDMPFHVVGE